MKQYAVSLTLGCLLIVGCRAEMIQQEDFSEPTNSELLALHGPKFQLMIMQSPTDKERFVFLVCHKSSSDGKLDFRMNVHKMCVNAFQDRSQKEITFSHRELTLDRFDSYKEYTKFIETFQKQQKELAREELIQYNDKKKELFKINPEDVSKMAYGQVIGGVMGANIQGRVIFDVAVELQRLEDDYNVVKDGIKACNRALKEKVLSIREHLDEVDTQCQAVAFRLPKLDEEKYQNVDTKDYLALYDYFVSKPSVGRLPDVVAALGRLFRDTWWGEASGYISYYCVPSNQKTNSESVAAECLPLRKHKG